MKHIMILIVTMIATTLTIQASSTHVAKEFTVTQIALDTQAEAEAAMSKALEAIDEDKNQTKEGGETKE